MKMRKLLGFILPLFVLTSCVQPQVGTTTTTKDDNTTTTSEDVKTWDEEILNLMKSHLDGYVVPYVEVYNAQWVYNEELGALLYLAENVEYTTYRNYVNDLLDHSYVDKSDEYATDENQIVLIDYYDDKNPFNFVQCQPVLMGEDGTILTDGVGFFAAAFYSQRAQLEYPKQRIDEDMATFFEGKIKSFPEFTLDFTPLHYAVFDMLVFIGFSFTIYGGNGVESIKTGLNNAKWTHLKDGPTSYYFHDDKNLGTIELFYDETLNATNVIVSAYRDVYVTWPEDKIKKHLAELNIEETIPDPKFDFTRLAYDVYFSLEDGYLEISASYGNGYKSYKETLLNNGWTLLNDGTDGYLEFISPNKTAYIMLEQKFENTTVITVYQYSDTGVWPSETISNLMAQLGLGDVNIPALTMDNLEYQVEDFYPEDGVIQMYIIGNSIIAEYSKTLKENGWSVYSNATGLTAFDPTNKVQINAVYDDFEGYTEVIIGKKEEGYDTWPEEKINELLTQLKADETFLPLEGGFLYQLYLEDMSYNSSIGVYVWTRDTSLVTTYCEALKANGWVESDSGWGDYNFSKGNCFIEVMDGVESDGAISIFFYADKSKVM